MILYRVIRRETHSMVLETRFKTSLIDATRVGRAMPAGTIVISKCHVRSDLKASDWIDLLEADAPGCQEVNHTSVDFIDNETHVKTIEVKK